MIADFGLAVVLERTIMRATTSRADGAGTAAYMAPEQHDSETFGSVSCKTDIWALGCIISEMLSGDVPWAGKRLPEIMMNVAMKKRHPPIPDGPAELQAALRGCFVHEQAERFSAEDLMAALQPLVPVQPAGGGGQAAGDTQALPAEFETQLAAQRAANAQLQGQVAALTQQMADQAVQTQRQFADAQKRMAVQIQQVQQQADQKLANLSRQLQEDMERRIVEHAADAPVAPGLSAATAGWLQELDQELQRQQQMAPEPEPQQHQPRSVVLAAQSATAAAGGVDPLQAEMEKHGLTSSDRAVLFQGGVTTLRTFHLIQDEDFAAYGIDIAARRAAKEVRDLLQREGGDISAAGQAATVQGTGTMARLCALDLAAMQQLGLGIVDRRFLANLLETSPTLAQLRRQQQQQQQRQQALTKALRLGFCVGNAQGQGTATFASTATAQNGTAVGGEPLDPSRGAVFWKATVAQYQKGALMIGVIGNPRPAADSRYDPTCFGWDAGWDYSWAGGQYAQNQGGYTSFAQGDVLIFKLEARQLSLRVARLGAQTFTLSTNGVQGLRTCVCSGCPSRVEFSAAQPGEEY